MPRNGAETVWTGLLSINAGIGEELFFRLALPLLIVLVTGNVIAAFAVAAIVFGLVHVYQGWVGVLATTFLGVVFTGALPAGRQPGRCRWRCTSASTSSASSCAPPSRALAARRADASGLEIARQGCESGGDARPREDCEMATGVDTLISPAMQEAKGKWGEPRISPPIAASDIRKWAIATYWPETPPQIYWDDDYAKTTKWGGDHRACRLQPVRLAGAARAPRGARPQPAGGLRLTGMNGGQTDTYGAPMRPGDVITARSAALGLQRAPGPLRPDALHLQRDRMDEPEGRVRPPPHRHLDPLLGAPQMTVKVYFEDVSVGDEMPAWSRTTDFMHWNRYAAVNDEFVPFHMDDEAGRKAGNKQGAFGMGNLRYAYLVNALRDWIGDEAEIREIGCQYRAINQKNDTLTVVGKVVEKEVVDGENRVKLTTNVMNQAGEATCPGHAVVVLPSRG